VSGSLVDRLLDSSLQLAVVRAFTTLRLADALATRAQSIDHLATATGCQRDRLARLIVAASGLGLCEVEGGQVRLTAEGGVLRSDTPDSMASWVELMTSPWFTQPWMRLAEAVRDRSVPFEQVHGQGFWEYVAAHPDEGAIFDAAMTNGARDRADALDRALDVSRWRTVVDVGGGQGQLVAALLDRWPELRGVVADRAEVLAGATPLHEATDVVDRVTMTATDFFVSVPQGGDVYLLSRVLHDWSDEDALRILSTVRAAMTPEARLYVLEDVASQSAGAHPDDRLAVAMKDLNMLVLVGGQERSFVEYEALLATAGFSPARLLGERPECIIEAVPTGRRAP
jgi:hypothetical protein